MLLAQLDVGNLCDWMRGKISVVKETLYKISECSNEGWAHNCHALISVISSHPKMSLYSSQETYLAFCAHSHWNYMYLCSQMFESLLKRSES